MERFWFEFDVAAGASLEHQAWPPFDDGAWDWLAAGVGVTAFDELDALSLIRERAGGQLPRVATTATSTDADRRAMRIEPGRPVGNPSWRGVWFPTVPAADVDLTD